jgi:hypothetical protein
MQPVSPRAGTLVERHSTWNLLVLALHQVAVRVGWIFKTESVIVPFFLDTVTPDPALRGVLRGCLPVLNRVGQSVPPLYFADYLRRRGRKEWPLLLTSLLMALPFLALASVWQATGREPAPWLPGLFLGLYAVFFVVVGLNVLSFGTLQGKLIRPDRRGRLLGLSGIAGSLCSVLSVVVLMRPWLAEPDHGFAKIFGVTGVGFALAALLTLFVIEPRDDRLRRASEPRQPFRSAWRAVQRDVQLRRLVFAAMLFMCAMLLFPHYQALGRQRLSRDAGDLMWWVVVQNIGVGLFSLGFGRLADRCGYRLTVRVQMFAVSLVPTVALVLASDWIRSPWPLYWLTFFLLGLTPVTVRSFDNFALELAGPADHAAYLSTLRLFMAVPFLLSPLVGLVIELETVGFAPVFLATSGLVAAGALLTFRLGEPRHAPPKDRQQ